MTSFSKHILLSFLLLISITTLVTAHKESSQTLQEAGSYNVRFGLIPGIVVEGESESLYLGVTRQAGSASIRGMEATISIFRDHPITLEQTDKASLTSLGLLVRTYVDIEEQSPGVYAVSHTFTEKGPYFIIADLYDKGEHVTTITRHIHVEPNGPSSLFWMYMLFIVIGGFYFATKSHKL